MLQDSFHTTRWTRVVLAKVPSEEGRRALADLCEAYYEPVIAFLRCRMESEDAAREMAHEFFARLLSRGGIEGAEPGRGKFRSYLLGAVKHFVSHHREAAGRQKRGGGMEPVSLSATEVGLVCDPQMPSPDAVFDRTWAVTLLSRALASLRAECASVGKAEFYDRIKPLLMGETEHGGQDTLAAGCGMTITAFRMAVHRLKGRLRKLVKAEIAATLDDPAAVLSEMETLFAALAG